MSAQLSIFDLPAPDLRREQEFNRRLALTTLVDVPRARNLDPPTSHRAASSVRKSMVLGRQQKAVLRAIRQFPGSTAGELAVALGNTGYWIRTKAGSRYEQPGPNRWYFIVQRRVSELAKFWVYRGAPSYDKFNETEQTTIWPNERRRIRELLTEYAEQIEREKALRAIGGYP